jgi:hypothetical protein
VICGLIYEMIYVIYEKNVIYGMIYEESVIYGLIYEGSGICEEIFYEDEENLYVPLYTKNIKIFTFYNLNKIKKK